MKILLINKYYYLRGGAERYFFDLKKILEEKGHTVIPFSMEHEKNERSEYEKYFAKKVEFGNILKLGFNIVKIFYNRDAVVKLKKLIKDEKPDIAHIHNVAHHLSPAIISILKKNNIPIVQTLHDYKLVCPAYLLFNKEKECRSCFGGKYYNCFLKKCIKNSRLKSFAGMCEAYLHNKILKTYDKVDVFIAPTNFVKNVCVEAGISGERIKVVNGFLSKMQEGGEYEAGKEGKDCSRDAIYRVFSTAENEGYRRDYVLYFGRLSREKGVFVLLDAMKKTDANLKLKIVGDGQERENLKLKIKNYGLGEKVEVVSAKYGDELKQIIKNSSVVIVPSICPETMSYSLLEAMYFGKIVIASRIGGMQEIVEDRKNGFLVEAGNSYELAKKINFLVSNFDINNISDNAQETVLRFNCERHYEEIMGIYKMLG